MRQLIYALALALPAAAHAQLAVVPKPVDTSTLATKSEVTAIAAQIPQPSDAVPPADMSSSGLVGSSPKFRRYDDQAPRISRTAKQQVTGSDGTKVVTWAAMASIPAIDITPHVAANETVPPTCYAVLSTVTTTGATIKCYVDQSLAGLGLLPRKPAAAGVVFDVIALP